MSRFIKTFYLWLGVATACNLASLVTGAVWASIPAGGLWLYPAAWLMQLPLLLLLSLIHHGLNQILHLLPERHAGKAHWLLCSTIMFLFTGLYLASQIMRIEINSFLSWDMLRVAISDTRQILPDIGSRIGFHLLALGGASALLGLLYARRYHNTLVEHSSRRFTIMALVFACSVPGSYAYAFKALDESAWRARNEILPTTYLATSLVEDFLRESRVQEAAIESIVLPPKPTMDEYLKQSPPQATPHVFFILLESVPWDRFAFTGYARTDTTPNLNALAEESIVFPRTYATANHSSYAQPSVHSSQYPLRSRSLDRYLNVDYPKTMLIDILAEAGYQTAFISAQNEEWLGMKRFIFANTTLQHFLHSKDELGEHIGRESKIDDSLVCTRALEYLDRRNPEQPVFLYMNFQRTHFPYDIPEEAPRPYQPCDTDGFQYTFLSYDRDYNDVVNNKFDNALHYVDAQVGRLIDYLKQNGLYENSIIVVSADHGQAFYQHGLPTHSTTLYDDQMRVCTLIKQPGRATPSVRNDAISLIDINPTILEILGMENHPSFQGEPVLRAPRSNPIYLLSHGLVKAMGVVDYPWKYLVSETHPARLFNLETDPSETTNLTSQYPGTLQAMQEALEYFRQKQFHYYMDLKPEERARLCPPRL